MNRRTVILFGLAAMAMPREAFACGGIVAPVIVPFAGTKVDLIQAQGKKGKRIQRRILVEDVRETETKGAESGAYLITLAKGKERKEFRLAYPPRTRGCNQPYLS